MRLRHKDSKKGTDSDMAFDVILGMALVLGVLILVHEWGHFIVARLFGVRVDVFSIGFGPRLFGWKRGATDYRISVIPLGGYVRMAGQDLSEVDSSDAAPTGAPDELMSKPRWQRALISFAGPAVNLIFPIILLAGFFAYVGIPYSDYLDKSVQIVAVPPNAPSSSPDALQPRDQIVSINGQKTPPGSRRRPSSRNWAQRKSCAWKFCTMASFAPWRLRKRASSNRTIP
jgi:regulator of sigma E protease